MSLQQKWRSRSRNRDQSLAVGHLCVAAPFARYPRQAEGLDTHLKSFAGNLRNRVADLVSWNNKLSMRVQSQVEQLERLGRLRRFLSRQVAEVIVSQTDDPKLSCDRREIAVFFCDLRGFTAFSDSVSPEAVLDVLEAYHQAMGELIDEFEGTIEHRAGDGIMVIFNAPLPCNDPATQAVRMAVAMRDRMRGLSDDWRKLGYELGFGVGVSLGYATLGMVGSEGRLDYVANGRVVNLASRLCDEALDGEILLSELAHDSVKQRVEAHCIGELSLKGFRQQVKAFNVIGPKSQSPSSRGPRCDKDHARNHQQRAAQLEWSQWLSEEEIGDY